MSREEQFISKISSHLPRSRNQLNKLFESDAEILEVKSGKLIFTVDEFSEEDNFLTDDPYLLGWNLAVATISDIFATGGCPTYFSHSMSINPEEWNDAYIDRFAAGLADVLKSCGASFIGGDFGFSKNWSYTGIAFGNTENTLTRKGAKPGDELFMTGNVGVGNAIAAVSFFQKNAGREFQNIKLELRKKEAELISKYATCGIDSSDGMANTILMLGWLNQAGFLIDNIHYHPLGTAMCKVMAIPLELLFLGECGEYELVFCIDRDNVDEFLEKAEKLKLNFTRIGQVIKKQDYMVKTISSEFTLNEFKIRGRDFNHPIDYYNALNQYLKNYGNTSNQSN